MKTLDDMYSNPVFCFFLAQKPLFYINKVKYGLIKKEYEKQYGFKFPRLKTEFRLYFNNNTSRYTAIFKLSYNKGRAPINIFESSEVDSKNDLYNMEKLIRACCTRVAESFTQ